MRLGLYIRSYEDNTIYGKTISYEEIDNADQLFKTITECFLKDDGILPKSMQWLVMATEGKLIFHDSYEALEKANPGLTIIYQDKEEITKVTL